MLLKIIRESLGQLIVTINFLTLPRKMKRSTNEQALIDQQVSKMSLYQFKRCPFCVRTRRTIHKLNLPMQYRDASKGSAYRQELEAGGGEIKVPCLRIEEDGETQWLYESAEIITFLNSRFGIPQAVTGQA